MGDLAIRFGEMLERPARLEGSAAATALLSNSAQACALLGSPPTPVEQVMRWTADWLKQGGRVYDKPTHFEIRDGQY